MDTKEQQILQPTSQILQYQQEGLKFCIALKATLFFLTLSFVLQLFTEIPLKCKAIGVSMLITYFIAIKSNFQDAFLSYFFHKSTKLQKMFVAMTIILIFQVRFLSFITAAIWMICYICYTYQMVYKNLNSVEENQRKCLFFSVIVIIQWQAIVLKIQGYLDDDWRGLVSGIFIVMIMLLLPMGIMTLFLLCKSHREEEYIDEFHESSWYLNHRKQTLYTIFIVYSGYMSIFIGILQVYINEEVYKYMLVTIFALTIIEMLLYIFSFKSLVVLFLGYDKFAERIVVNMKNGHFRQKDELQKRKYIEDQKKSIQICCFCTKQANIVHKSCENMIFCLQCFQEYVTDKKWNCIRCKGYSHNYSYYYTCSRQKLSKNQNNSMRKISDYLGQGEQISVLL